MKEPLVSVIIPVYNTEKYVRRAVESILEQTYRDVEIILVDDGSNDNSQSVCRAIEESNKRVKYFLQPHNGVSAARNKGIKEAQGKYLFFCDSDDAWKENLLEEVVAEFENANCDMVRFGFESKNEEVITAGEMLETELGQRELLIQYFSNNIIYRNMSSCVFGGYRSQIIKENGIIFDEELVYGEDGKFTMQYLLQCDRIKLLNQYLYIYYPCFEDRINATARKYKELYNEYELCMILFGLFYGKWNDTLSKEEKSIAYHGFYDRLIGRLVRYAAYAPKRTIKENVQVLKKILNEEMLKEAGKYYHRFRRKDSYLIPYFMKKKYSMWLWCWLKIRSKSYYRQYGRKQYGVSIYKKDSLVKYKWSV